MMLLFWIADEVILELMGENANTNYSSQSLSLSRLFMVHVAVVPSAFIGIISGTKVHILVDEGAFNNLTYSYIVHHLKLPIDSPFLVQISDLFERKGDSFVCDISLATVQGHSTPSKDDDYVLVRVGFDLVIRSGWLATLWLSFC